MAVTDIRLWICLLFGIAISISFNQVPKTQKLKVSKTTIDWLFLTFNVLFLIWNTSFTLNITAIAARPDKMNEADVNSLLRWANAFQILAIIVLGFLVGEVAFAVVQGIRNKRKGIATDRGITSPDKLDSIAEEFKQIKMARDDIDNFYKKVSAEVNKGQTTGQSDTTQKQENKDKTQ